MARPQVREVSAPSAIQGVAAPVSTYVRPADPGRSPLHELAEGLAAFNSGLGALLDKRKAESEAAEAARANVDFHRNNQEGYAEAVRQGKIPAWASDAYVQSYKKQQGNLAGLRLRDRFNLAYQQWEGRHDADHDGYAAWAAQWVAQNVGDEQDPYILAGLAPHLESLTLGGMDTFSTERDTRLKENARATTGALVTHSLEEAHDEYATTGQIDWDTHWGNILAEREAALARGDNGVAVDSLIVDSILLQAERTADMDYLKLLDRTLPGQTQPLALDPKVREAVTKSQDRIKATQGALASDIASERDRMEKQQQEELWADTLGRILKGEPVPEENIVTLERRDGEARIKVARYQKEAVGLDTQEDPESLLDVFTQIDQGAGAGFVIRMREQGVIRDPATLTKALDRVKAVQNALKDGGVFTSPTYKDIVKLVTNETGPTGITTTLDGTGPISAEGMEALYDFRQMLLDWETRNPNASMMEKEKAAREAGEIIRSRIVPDNDMGLHGQYISDADRADMERQAAREAEGPGDSPAEEEASNPFGGYSFIPNPIQSFREWWNGPQQPEDAPVAAPEPRVEQSPAPALESLSEARRSAVESLASGRGISAEEANQQLHDKLLEIMDEADPGIDRETTGSISQESRDGLANLFDNPPQVSSDTPLATAYVDPKSNPSVASAVLERFAGKRLPVSIRNNNMGAISITGDIQSSWAAKQPGFVGTTKRPAAEGGHYAKYATPEHGVAAASRLLERYGQQGVNTPEAIVKKWSTDTKAHGAYARTLSKYLTEAGVEAGVDTPLDLTDPKVRIAVLKAKSAHESDAGVPVYADAVFERGANYRLGETSGEKQRGLAALAPNGLVASSKRGYKPDLDNLRPEIRTGVESLQKAWGRELPIVSGFRDPARNRKAGGAKKSQHQHGNAVDIDVSTLSQAERIELIRLASSQGFKGIGVYANSIHLDYGTKRYWGPSHGAKSLPAWAKDAIEEHMKRA